MRWAEITIETTLQAKDAVSEVMLRNGCSGTVVQEAEPVSIKCYLPADDRLEQRLADIKGEVCKLSDFGLDPGTGKLTVGYAEEQDWAESWRQYFHVTRVGKRIVIKPTWEEFTPERRDVVVELDTGMAFGTGSHQTTRLCLLAMEKYLRPRSVVVDFGTGSGVLAIAAAKMGASTVIAFDDDPIAVKAARENVVRNDAEERVEVHQASSPAFVGKEVDLVIANIVAEVIIASAEDIASILRIGGRLIASGITGHKAFDVEQALRNVGFDMTDRFNEDQWVALVATKSS